MTDEILDIPTPIATEIEEKPEGYQVLVVNIAWSKDSIRPMKKDSEKPDAIPLDIPENVLNQAKKKHNVFNDIIETYVCNTLTKKYGYEVCHCQIWLPLEDPTEAA